MTSKQFLEDQAQVEKNIDQHQQLELNLRRQALIFENIYDGIIMTNLDGKIVDWNPGAERMFGYTKEEALGNSPDFVHRPNEETISQSNLREHFLSASKWTGVVKSITKTGEKKICEVTIVPLVDSSGVTIGTIGVNHDITQWVIASQEEHEQRALAEALQNTAAALNSTLDLDALLDLILVNASKVVPHDAATLMSVKNGIARIERSLGYAERGLADYAHHFCFPVREIPNLRILTASGMPLAIDDTHTYPGWVSMPEVSWIRSYAAAPIRIKGDTVGFINLDSATPGFFNKTLADRLMAFANQAAIAIQNARLYAEVQELAITDELTGLYNRRGLFALGRHEVERSLRFNRPLSILFLDLDYFKAVNDSHSHIIGNEVLRALAALFRKNTRSVDLVGRYGGDEFVIILPEIDGPNAVQVAERLRSLIQETPVLTLIGKLSMTASIGVAQLRENVPDLDTLLDNADKAMYIAKQSGRNKVII